MHESKRLNGPSLKRWAPRRDLQVHGSCGVKSPREEAPGQKAGSPSPHTKLRALAQALEIPYWRLDQIEAHCHAERPDEPTALLQRRVLVLFTEQLHDINCSYNRQRRFAREILDGHTVYQDDDDETDAQRAPDATRMPEMHVKTSPDLAADIRRMLMRQVNLPSHQGLRAGSRGTADDAVNGLSVTVSLQTVNGVIDAVGFQASGDPLLAGCASFVLEAVLGQRLAWARCVRTDVLAYVLRLDGHERMRARLVLSALHSAVKNAVRELRERKPEPTSRSGGSRGHRTPSDAAPLLTARDRALLLPGEMAAVLLRERAVIVGVLESLQECLALSDVALPSALTLQRVRGSNGEMQCVLRPDFTNQRSRQDVRCLAQSVQAALFSLSADERQFVDQLAGHGTQRDVAAALGVTQATVHNRLWGVAYKIQKFLRQP